MEPIVIRSCFGHEIMAMQFANVLGCEVLVCPSADNEKEYNQRAEKIARFMSYFGDLKIVPFCERGGCEAWDVIADLKTGKLGDLAWLDFFKSKLEPMLEFNEPDFDCWGVRRRVLVIPQKLLSDNLCGVTAQDQSLNPELFSFLRKQDYTALILGQHFDKEADLKAVTNLEYVFGPCLYVPGLTENHELLGLRGVEHRLYHNLYRGLTGSVGIAGTHTWILLTVFPEVPQVILYNKKGVENWQAIARAARRQGYNIVAIGFDNSTDMSQLSKQIEKACRGLGII